MKSASDRSAGRPDDADLIGGIELDRLPRLSVAELRGLWNEHIGTRTPPPVQRSMLIRELAWRVQERRDGGLDRQTVKLLKSAMRSAAASLKPPSAEAPHAKPRRLYRPAAARSLQTSTKLLRSWRGRIHEVDVLDDGKRFRYKGEEYKTLSEIARLITGTHLSGPRFFGLTGKRRDDGGAEE